MTSRKTVLIVDDEPLTLDVVEGFLALEGYELAFANNGTEALNYVKKQEPDIILLDVMMPDIDGFTVCRRLKANDKWRYIPVILITALSKENLGLGVEAGADDFLQKPINGVELRIRVRSMLRIKKQYDELQTHLLVRENMAQMIVHNIRIPLTSIIEYSNLLHLRNTLSTRDLEDVDKIKLKAQGLNSFLDDMLIVAKMEDNNELILNRSRVDINQLIKQVTDNQDITLLKRLPIIKNLPSESPHIFLDETLFQRVLDHLISNALKFSPAHSTVTVRVEYLAQKDGLDSEQAKIRIQILDQGPGIKKEDQDTIFNKLAQHDTAQTGLGLIFCKMVVEAHGGRIFIENNEHRGSIFTIDI